MAKVLDPVTRYANAVIKGDIPAGKYIRLAAQRHLNDLKEGKKRGIYFDVDAAQHALDFYQFLKHSKGKWAGQSFELSPWQEFIVGSVFGWKREDGYRRFRTAYNEIPRKNGKSTLSSGVGLYLLAADGEAGAEVYAAATKREQAKIVFSEASRMVKASPELRKVIGVFAHNLHIQATASKLEPLGADADTMDGLNVHGAIIDELHAHKTRAVVDVMETATGARTQPLQFEITTAGYNRNSVCWEHRLYTTQILEGFVEDDTWFGFIACIDEGDDWKDPNVWYKANPNLGISVYLDDLKRKADKAKQLPAAQNAFRRLHLNQWTEQAERWLDIEAWDECGNPVDIEELAGRSCYGGLDLASTTDVAALVWLFPPEQEDEKWKIVTRFWVPKESIKKRSEKDKVPYDVWAKQGLLEATDGNVVNYNVIEKRILEDCARFTVLELAYDRWNATQIITNLDDEGVNVIGFGQGFQSMSAPTKELEKLVISKELAHGGHPILRWMAGNVAVKQDPAGNLKPAKDKSTEKIDGIVALIMALGRAIVQEGEGPSIYESRGILEF